MEAGGIFPAVLNAAFRCRTGLQDALTAAADTVAEKYIGAEASAMVGASCWRKLL